MPRKNLHKFEPDFQTRLRQQEVAKGVHIKLRPKTRLFDGNRVVVPGLIPQLGVDLDAYIKARPELNERSILGAGAFSTVATVPGIYKGTKVVVKENKERGAYGPVSESEMEGGIVWALYCAINQDDVHLPRIYGVDLRDKQPRVYMEALEEADVYDMPKRYEQYEELRDSFNDGFMGRVSPATCSMYRHGAVMNAMFYDTPLGCDTHVGNFMRRGENIVVTDPICKDVHMYHPNLQALINHAGNYCTVLT